MISTEGLPDDCHWFENQIAGHHPSVIKNGKREIGLLKRAGQEDKILKPKQDANRGDCEVSIYDLLTESKSAGDYSPSKNWPDVPADDVRAFAGLTPAYYGTERLVVDGDEHEFMVLEDASTRYSRPAILDIKMGTKTYDPSASESKKKKSEEKYPPQATLGYRLLGYRIYDEDDLKVQDKDWGISFGEETVAEGLREFFAARPGDLAEQATVCLQPVLDWFEAQRSFQFFASSLLVLYENDPLLPLNMKMYMIDFGHVYPGNGDRDEGYLLGLRRLMADLKSLAV